MDERMDAGLTPSPLGVSHRLQRDCAGWPFAGGSAQCGRDRVSQAPPQWLCAVRSWQRGGRPLRSARQERSLRRGTGGTHALQPPAHKTVVRAVNKVDRQNIPSLIVLTVRP